MTPVSSPTPEPRRMEPCPLCAGPWAEDPCRECGGTGEVPVDLLPQRGIQATADQAQALIDGWALGESHLIVRPEDK